MHYRLDEVQPQPGRSLHLPLGGWEGLESTVS